MKNQKSKKLFIVWAVSQVILLVACAMYVVSCYLQGNEPRLENSIYSTLVILSVVLYSLPMLFAAQYFAKKEQNKRILVTARVTIVFFAYWLFLCIFPV
jgi:hypothetical protein